MKKYLIIFLVFNLLFSEQTEIYKPVSDYYYLFLLNNNGKQDRFSIDLFKSIVDKTGIKIDIKLDYQDNSIKKERKIDNKPSLKLILLYVLIIIIPFIIITITSYIYILKRQVRFKTEELTKSNQILKNNNEKLEATIKELNRTNKELEKLTSELEKSEKKFKLLFTEMTEAFALHEIICDINDKPVDYRFLLVNKAFEEITGLKASDIIGRTVLEVLPNTEYYWIENYGNVALTGQPIQFEEYSQELGKYYSVKAYSPEYKKFAVIFTDVTEIKKYEIELKKNQEILQKQNIELEKAKRCAEHAAMIKSQFLSNMSHEIRNPLNGIIGLSNLLSKTNLDNQQKEYLELIKASNEILLSIVNDILDLSKIEQGKREIKPELVNIKLITEELIKSFYYQAKLKNISIVSNISSEINDFIVIDISSYKQIFINLISNAIKFTEKGEVTVSLIINNNNKLELTISDTGIGIPEDKIDLIFDKFYQVDTSFTKKFKGTGLGLAIVKELADLLNIKIKVNSKPGVGSSFILEFPILFEKNIVKNDIKQKEINNPVFINRTKKVLIVEDNFINSFMIQKTLEKYGYKTENARDGAEALEKIKNQKFDIILMDIQMPEMNGIEATIEMRKAGIDTPIIAMTGYSMDEDINNFLKSGINDYIIKPINENLILEKLDKFNF